MRVAPRGARLLGLAIFVVGTIGCAYWAYMDIAPWLPLWGRTGSGGIGAVSAGLPFIVFLLLPIFTLLLSRGTGRLGTWLRWLVVCATVALFAIGISGLMLLATPALSLALFALFPPLQLFFFIAAIALRVRGTADS